HSPISALVLCNGDLDHTVGLFTLRESYPLVIYTTRAVWRGLVDQNVMMRTLQRFEGQVTWRPLELGVETAVVDAGGQGTGVFVTARPVPGKLPIHLEGVVAASAE